MLLEFWFFRESFVIVNVPMLRYSCYIKLNSDFYNDNVVQNLHKFVLK